MGRIMYEHLEPAPLAKYIFVGLQGSPLPVLLEDDMATLVEVGVGNESTILVDELS